MDRLAAFRAAHAAMQAEDRCILRLRDSPEKRLRREAWRVLVLDLEDLGRALLGDCPTPESREEVLLLLEACRYGAGALKRAHSEASATDRRWAFRLPLDHPLVIELARMMAEEVALNGLLREMTPRHEGVTKGDQQWGFSCHED